jgi:hypothetical protein
MKEKKSTDAYPYASGGWGSLKAVTQILTREHVALKDGAVLAKQNKPDGFMCVSCSWAKPAEPHALEFCESGAKATAWDITSKRMTPEFFQLHTVTELLSWHDHDLEAAGRLTAPGPERQNSFTSNELSQRVVNWARKAFTLIFQSSANEPGKTTDQSAVGDRRSPRRGANLAQVDRHFVDCAVLGSGRRTRVG